VFSVADAERLAGQFRALLESATAQPDTRIGALGMLSEVERRQLLVEFNATPAEFRSQESEGATHASPVPMSGVRSEIGDLVCVHELIAAQAAHTPDAVAVVFDRRPTTDDR